MEYNFFQYKLVISVKHPTSQPYFNCSQFWSILVAGFQGFYDANIFHFLNENIYLFVVYPDFMI